MRRSAIASSKSDSTAVAANKRPEMRVALLTSDGDCLPDHFQHRAGCGARTHTFYVSMAVNTDKLVLRDK